ncbi:MAG: hybrid sensor histidine kinase/response regulator [bacterium]|nr:hybrid sensor histidine kinase/response regulator [bacterium]
MDFSEEELNQIFKIFKYETQEHIDNINKALLSIEKDPTNSSIIAELFREAHSIKGSARMLDISSIQKLAHKIEDLLKLAKDGIITINTDIIDIIYEATDTISKVVKKLKPTNLDYSDKNLIELTLKIDLIRDSMLLEEKKKSGIKDVRKIESLEKNIVNEHDVMKFVRKNISLLDNKFQKDNAIQALLNLIEEELSKGLPNNNKNILKQIKENLIYIKDNDILPSMDIAQIIEHGLKTIETNPTEEECANIIKRQQSIRQILEIKKEHDDIYEITKIVPNNLQQEQSEIKHKPNAESYVDSSFKTLRVDTSKLDKLEQQTEELIVLKIKNKQHVKVTKEALSEIQDLQKHLNKALVSIKDNDKRAFTHNSETYGSARLLQKQLDKAHEKLEKLQFLMNSFQKDFFEDDSKFQILSEEIESTVKSIRIIPIATILHMFPRMVRDISRNQGKQVEITISGSETGADKTIIEDLKAPLIHIINNAIDHGIESPQERIKKGKNPTGKIILNSYHQDNSIIIEIIDDGQGVNIQKIKDKAIKEKFLSEEELSQLSDHHILNLLFWPGFTTESKVTNLSGRGVGLDVVHNTISQMDGKVSISTKPDEGFKILIKIPIAIATLKVLLVKVKKQIFGIPSGYVKHVRSIISEDIFSKEGKPHIMYNGTSIRYTKLSSLLHYEQDDNNSNKHDIVIIQYEDTYLAIEIDELLRTEEIIQKKLNPPLSRVKNIAGISSLPSGEPCFILNINDIIKAPLSSKDLIKSQTILTLPQKAAKTFCVLIVDDSYTTLMLEKNILKLAGYKVLTATNGSEALKKLTYEKADVIITDLEMPKMDGIEFVKKVREKDTAIPIIVLTSHEEKLPNIYVQNYTNDIILKKDFSKELFLDTIEQNIHK